MAGNGGVITKRQPMFGQLAGEKMSLEGTVHRLRMPSKQFVLKAINTHTTISISPSEDGENAGLAFCNKINRVLKGEKPKAEAALPQRNGGYYGR